MYGILFHGLTVAYSITAGRMLMIQLVIILLHEHFLILCLAL